MRIVPDYETLECRFKFGKAPSLEEEEEARSVACLGGCPALGTLREKLAQGPGSPSKPDDDSTPVRCQSMD